jgi:hypothetical protein
VQEGWYPLKIEYFEAKAGARMRLLWGNSAEEAKLVPARHLCCRGKKK